MGLFDALGSLFDPSQNIALANQGFAAQTAGTKSAKKDVKAGKAEALGYQDLGISPWQTQLQQGQRGVDYYGQLVGLPGAENAPGIQQTLEGIPGYQFAMQQGQQAVNRNAANTGRLASGNTDIDTLRFSQGLADQNYFNYLNALQPYFGQSQNAASGIQTGYTNKAGIATNTAQQLANLATQQGQYGYQNAMNIAGANNTAGANSLNAILGVGGMLTGGLKSFFG